MLVAAVAADRDGRAVLEVRAGDRDGRAAGGVAGGGADGEGQPLRELRRVAGRAGGRGADVLARGDPDRHRHVDDARAGAVGRDHARAEVLRAFEEVLRETSRRPGWRRSPGRTSSRASSAACPGCGARLPGSPGRPASASTGRESSAGRWDRRRRRPRRSASRCRRCGTRCPARRCRGWNWRGSAVPVPFSTQTPWPLKVVVPLKAITFGSPAPVPPIVALALNDVDAGSGVAQGGGSSGVGADHVALDRHVAAGDADAIASVGGDDVVEDAVVALVDLDAAAPVAETGGPGHVGPDVVAADGVVVDVVAEAAREVDAHPEVSGDDVALSRGRSADRHVR